MASNAAARTSRRDSPPKSGADRIQSPPGKPTNGLKLADIRKAVRAAFENREPKRQQG